MPIVGIVHYGRDSLAISAGMHSKHDGKRPGLLGRLGVGQQLLFIALHAIAAEMMDALRPQAAMGHHGNAGRDQRRDHFGLFGAPFEFHRLAAAFP